MCSRDPGIMEGPMSFRPTLPAVAAFLCAAPVSPSARPAPVVEYREAVMKSLAAHLRAVTLIATGSVLYRDQAAAHASSIDDAARTLTTLFPPGSGPEAAKTEALDGVWKDEAGFRAAAARLQAESAGLVGAAKRNDAAALRAQAEAVSKACAACHDVYRQAR
jgi:cytochrome c556